MTEVIGLARDRRRGIGLILISAFFFALMGAMVKHVGSALPAVEVAFFRAFVNVILIAPLMFYRKVSFFGFNRRVLFTRSVAGFLGLSLSFYVAARIKLADATILQNTATVFVAILSVFVLNERLSFRLILFIALAFLGAVLVIKPSFEVLNVPGLVGLAGAFFSGIAYVSIKKLHSSEHSLTIVFNFALYSTLIGAVFLLFCFKVPSVDQLVALLLMGTLGALGQISMTKGFSYAPASLLSPYNFAGILFASILGALFWGEVPDFSSLIGAVLIVIAGIGIVRSEVG